MAEITVKLFGVYRSDTHLAAVKMKAAKVIDIFDEINRLAGEVYSEKKKENPSLEKPEPVKFKDAIVYINGEKCSKKSRELKDGEEIWVMSPASGG